MERATAEERARKAAAAFSDSRKRPPSSTLPTDPAALDANKRVKLDHADPSASLPASILSAFDFTTLPAPLITELIVANLQAIDEPTLIRLVQNYRQSIPVAAASSQPAGAVPMAAPVAVAAGAPGSSEIAVTPQAGPSTSESPAAGPSAGPSVPSESQPPETALGSGAAAEVKEEPVDPLQMDIDQDELDFDSERLNRELAPMQEDDDAAALAALDTKALLSLDFHMPPPQPLSELEREALVRSGVARIWEGKDELSVGALEAISGVAGVGPGAKDMWMLLIVRMVTRVVDPYEGEKSDDEVDGEGSKEEEGDVDGRIVKLYERQDRLRRTLCDYVMKDFSGRYVFGSTDRSIILTLSSSSCRIQLATTWMNEEWYNDQVRQQQDRDWVSLSCCRLIVSNL